MSKLKIAFFVSQFPTVTETFILNQIIDLKQRGHTIKIFSKKKPEEGLIHCQVAEHNLMKDVVYLDSLPRSRVKKLFQLFKVLLLRKQFSNLIDFIRFVKKAKKYGLAVYDYLYFFDALNYQILHAHFGVNGNYVTKLRDAGLFGKSRFITTFHGYDLEVEKNNRDQYARLFKRCDVFTVNSEFSRNKLLQIGCSSEKIEKLPVGLDTTLFTLGMKKTNEIIRLNILFVGRLIYFKGPDLLVEIASILKYSKCIPFSMMIIGDGEMKNELREKIKQQSLESEITIAGPKSQIEIKEAMQMADIFLFPGRTDNGRAENQGLVLQEAQAMSLPVVISDAGGMKEGMIDKVTGFVVEEGNVEMFANVVEQLAKDTTKIREMGIEARNFVERNYSISLLNDRMLSIYLGQEQSFVCKDNIKYS